MRKVLAAAGLIGALMLPASIAGATNDHGNGHTPVTICHKPGTPAEHTLVVDDDAVPAHLAHGDYLGPCHPDVTIEPPPDTEPPVDTTPPPVVTTPPPITPPAPVRPPVVLGAPVPPVVVATPAPPAATPVVVTPLTAG